MVVPFDFYIFVYLFPLKMTVFSSLIDLKATSDKRFHADGVASKMLELINICLPEFLLVPNKDVNHFWLIYVSPSLNWSIQVMTMKRMLEKQRQFFFQRVYSYCVGKTKAWLCDTIPWVSLENYSQSFASEWTKEIKQQQKKIYNWYFFWKSIFKRNREWIAWNFQDRWVGLLKQFIVCRKNEV